MTDLPNGSAAHGSERVDRLIQQAQANGRGLSDLVQIKAGTMSTGSQSLRSRHRPQETYAQTNIDGDSFFGRLRDIYANQVLKTQLEQLKRQGSYVAFKGGWHDAYDVRRVHNGMASTEGTPPSLFWESDVAKWIEAACYFLSSPDNALCTHKAEFDDAIDELVAMIAEAQQDDGYLNVYFTVVDPPGKLKNLRDFHEMYNAGHLIEAALAHVRYTGKRSFIDVMIKNAEHFMKHIGTGPGQIRGYPGHPEIELALLRLSSYTGDERFAQFSRYLLEERGSRPKELDGDPFFVYEAKHRRPGGDEATPPHLTGIFDLDYNMSNATLHDATAIVGHSVRALYLLTAAADAGGALTADAMRLWTDAVDNKMYQTGGVGSEPFSEGFSRCEHYLPQSTAEGGCYAETCASIALMMTSERLLSHQLDGKARDVMELALMNAVLGGGALDGKSFAYDNKHATCGDETATRSEWFEVCCCPPNLSRTLGMIGGYTWSSTVDETNKRIKLSVYLLLSAQREINLPDGQTATVQMSSQMPWQGVTEVTLSAPAGWEWDLALPKPAYAMDVHTSHPAREHLGFLHSTLPASSAITLSFALPIRLLAPHLSTNQDTLTVTRGPIVYVIESYDNPAVDGRYPHFEGVGLDTGAVFSEYTVEVGGVEVVILDTPDVYGAVANDDESAGWRVVSKDRPARQWTKLSEGLRFVPWFARANRGGAGRLRTALLRADQ